jgi:hypothetical protein
MIEIIRKPSVSGKIVPPSVPGSDHAERRDGDGEP